MWKLEHTDGTLPPKFKSSMSSREELLFFLNEYRFGNCSITVKWNVITPDTKHTEMQGIQPAVKSETVKCIDKCKASDIDIIEQTIQSLSKQYPIVNAEMTLIVNPYFTATYVYTKTTD
jgi:hypothetical protein